MKLALQLLYYKLLNLSPRGNHMISPLQKQTAQAIINMFETGTIHGNYSQVTLLYGDSGGISYGRSQATLNSGNLYKLIKQYCATQQTKYGHQLSQYLNQLKQKDQTLNHNTSFKHYLEQAGNDPIMQMVQDQFFDTQFWQPALNKANQLSITTALGITIIYDSKIHGSLNRMINRTNHTYGRCSEKGEKNWIKTYVEIRYHWLSTHSNKILRKTTYRMETFRELIHGNNWDLDLPIIVRGTNIDEETIYNQLAIH